jgi:nanoRNase/pAp phosphatase (c-di-AMP/oligoRNAs hydrolase)
MQVVTTHKNTDFDGLASVIAATMLYPDSIGVVPSAVNNNVAKFLSTHKTAFNIVLPNEIDPEKVTRLIVVDTDQWRRLDRMERIRERGDVEILLWDHHVNGGDIGADWRCQEPIGATVTLLIREMKRREMELNPLVSTVLLIGLYEDTGHLSYPSTKAEDAAAAAYLLANGADLNVASVFLNPPYEEVQRDILFTMMQNTEKIKHNHFTIGINILRLEQKVPMLAAIVNMYRKIINADAVFVIFINDEHSSTAIGRSGVELIDVGAILKHFGGGGHPAAGSVTVKNNDYPPEQLKRKIIKQIRQSKAGGATVADLMSFPVTFVDASTPMSVIRDIMQEKKIRGILVGSETNLKGIVVLWDLKKLRLEKQWKSPVKAFMAREVATIAPDVQPAQAAQLMVEKNIGHLPVRHQGKIIGIVTRTDILTYFYGLLPE